MLPRVGTSFQVLLCQEPIAASLSRQEPPPEAPRLDTEGELAAALHELEGLGRLRSASVMGLLPTPRDYAAREAARHCRSLADHLLDADPMARPAPPLRHLSPPRPVHRPTRPHDKPSLGRCGDLRSLSRGGVTRPASAGRGSARRASARCGGSTTSSCARCQLHRRTLTQQPHPCTPRSTVSSLPCLPPNQVLCWTDFRTRSAAHCASKVLGVGLGLGLGLGSGQLGIAVAPMPPSPAIHGPGGADDAPRSAS